MADADPAGELPLELRSVAAGRQPEVERGIDQRLQLVGVEDLPGDRDHALAGLELFWGERLGVILGDQLKDACPEPLAAVS